MLLDIPYEIFQQHVLTRLEPQSITSLSKTCKTMQKAIQNYTLHQIKIIACKSGEEQIKYIYYQIESHPTSETLIYVSWLITNATQEMLTELCVEILKLTYHSDKSLNENIKLFIITFPIRHRLCLYITKKLKTIPFYNISDALEEAMILIYRRNNNENFNTKVAEAIHTLCVSPLKSFHSHHFKGMLCSLYRHNKLPNHMFPLLLRELRMETPDYRGGSYDYITRAVIKDINRKIFYQEHITRKKLLEFSEMLSAISIGDPKIYNNLWSKKMSMMVKITLELIKEPLMYDNPITFKEIIINMGLIEMKDILISILGKVKNEIKSKVRYHVLSKYSIDC